MAAMARLELARTELRTQALDRFAFIAKQYRPQDLNPDYSLIGQVCCQLHQAGVFKELAPGEGLEPSLSDFRDRRVATYTIPELNKNPGRTTGVEPASTRATISRLILSATFAIQWQGWRDLNSLSQA